MAIFSTLMENSVYLWYGVLGVLKKYDIQCVVADLNKCCKLQITFECCSLQCLILLCVLVFVFLRFSGILDPYLIFYVSCSDQDKFST